MRTRTFHIFALACFASLGLSGCDRLWPDCDWRSGKFVLIDIDARMQMSLCFDEGDGSTSQLVGPTIFSVGADDKYVVVKQHPGNVKTEAVDKSVTNYFVVGKADAFPSARNEVKGPFSEAEYRKLELSEHLPDFTTTFNDLK